MMKANTWYVAQVLKNVTTMDHNPNALWSHDVVDVE